MMTMQNMKAVKYSLAEIFGFTELPPQATMLGYQGDHPAVPPKKDYVFQREKVRDVMAFWTSGLTALKIQGDPATGKTSLVEQWHARLGWPLYKVSCNRSTEASRLIGCMLPISDGSLKWFDGPVLKAAKEGTSVLLDEYNTLDPDQATGLNMLLEGYSITIEQTGEVVTPQPGFRVFATENDVQSRLSVIGRNPQDAANDDRWMNMQADYLPADLETNAVMQALVKARVKQADAEMVAKQVVKLANDIRKAYRNEEDDIEVPMSTRSVIRWALLINRFQNVPKEQGGPMIYALHRAFAMRKNMADVVDVKARAQFGI
jgi:cobaltochelatase CobS